MRPREDRAVRVLRRAVRGRRLSRPQAATLDRLLSVVAKGIRKADVERLMADREARRTGVTHP